MDIEAGAELVQRIKPFAAATHRAGVIGGLGGFGGLFDPKAAGYDDPILVAATDGVGTKLRLAFAADRHDTVGIDLVAMCVNDLVVQGAEPLFFLDYFATGRLSPAAGAEVVKGVAAGCEIAGCALIGGETAEMPGMYADGEYDLAGFAVGAAERDRLLPRADIAAGDAILGLASSGLHSNGFSLVRHVLRETGTDLADRPPFDAAGTWADCLLAPTRIYVKSCLEAHRTGLVKGLAHITGGGLIENVPRILPDGLCAAIDPARWTPPPVFRWLMDVAGVAPAEMARTFNCGIGMVAVAAPGDVPALTAVLEAAGETVWPIGEIRAAPGPATADLHDIGTAWSA